VPRTLNKVLLIGFVGRPPELRYTPAGVPVATFSLAVPRTWETAEGEGRSTTEWFNVVVWRDLAETCHATLDKNTYVFIDGSLQTRTWRDAAGHLRQQTEVTASEVLSLGDQAPMPLTARAELDHNQEGELHP